MKQDIIIVGAGVVGLAAAKGLADMDFHVTVIDAGEIKESDLTNEQDLRVYAINKASQTLFERLDVWQDIADARISPYEKMHVWESQSQGVLDFDCVEMGECALGHIIEEAVIKNALIKHLANHKHINLISHEKLEHIDVTEQEIKLHGQERIYRANLLIGADGANSWVRTSLHFSCDKRPYHHHALVCMVDVEKSHEKTAYQIFTDDGVLAFLPLKDKHQCSIVWSNNESESERLKKLDDDAFKKALAHTFQHQLGAILQVSKRVSFPLFERVVTPYVKPRVLLMGDALHTIHPLAGLGVNVGLKDVSVFLDGIKDKPEAYSDYLSLRRYERSLKGYHLMMRKTMRALKDIYGQNLIPAPLRSIGMNFISNNHLVKKQVIKKAFGY